MTYQGERLEENVRELAESLNNPLILPCDVTDDAQIDAVFEAIDKEFGGLDFVVHGAAFAPREELIGAVRPDLARRVPPVAGRQRVLAHRARARRRCR